MSELPLLSSLIALPLVAAASLFLLNDGRHIRTLALAATLIETLLATVPILLGDFSQGGMLWLERYRWIPSLHIDYLVGIDGLSAYFLPLTALLTTLTVLASWNVVRHFEALFFALLLILESVTLGIFCALDIGLFFLFWELTLVPIYFLISLWGIGPNRRHAAAKFTLMMLGGGTLILVGFALLALNHAEQSSLQGYQGLSFDVLQLLHTPMSMSVQSAVFWLLFLGFAFKAPLFPFHVWLPLAAMEGPIALTALLTGLKLGVYGMIRFAIPLAPEASHRFAGLMAALGIFTSLYGGLLALRQTNLRRLLAYSSVSHVGLVVVGISTLNFQGLQGAIFQLVNFAVVAGGLFLVCGFIQLRTGSTDLTALGGLAKPLPLLSTLFFILGIAGLGIPGTNGFPAENLILLGAFKAHAGLGLGSLLSVIIGAAYFLSYFQRAFLGPVPERFATPTTDLRPREKLIAMICLAVILAHGLYPKAVLDITDAAIRTWLKHVNDIDPMTMANAR
jgi:NADH-quinone oxidoreductase subunit M